MQRFEITRNWFIKAVHLCPRRCLCWQFLVLSCVNMFFFWIGAPCKLCISPPWAFLRSNRQSSHPEQANFQIRIRNFSDLDNTTVHFLFHLLLLRARFEIGFKEVEFMARVRQGIFAAGAITKSRMAISGKDSKPDKRYSLVATMNFDQRTANLEPWDDRVQEWAREVVNGYGLRKRKEKT